MSEKLNSRLERIPVSVRWLAGSALFVAGTAIAKRPVENATKEYRDSLYYFQTMAENYTGHLLDGLESRRRGERRAAKVMRQVAAACLLEAEGINLLDLRTLTRIKRPDARLRTDPLEAALEVLKTGGLVHELEREGCMRVEADPVLREASMNPGAYPLLCDQLREYQARPQAGPEQGSSLHDFLARVTALTHQNPPSDGNQ